MLRPITLCLALVATPLLAANDSMSSIKDAAKKHGQSRLAEKLNLPTAAPTDGKVYFISPVAEASVNSPVKLVFGLAGMGVAPAGTQVDNTGHHHLLIDDPTVDLTLPLPASAQIVHFGKGQTETSLALTPGKHTLQLVLGDWKHQPFNPNLASDKITITVK